MCLCFKISLFGKAADYGLNGLFWQVFYLLPIGCFRLVVRWDFITEAIRLLITVLVFILNFPIQQLELGLLQIQCLPHLGNSVVQAVNQFAL